MTTLNPKERFDLIARNLDETLGEDRLKALLEQEGREISLYWGTATTGRPHLGYFVPLTKIADFLAAGVRVKVLLADVHAFLDNLKAPFELVSHRVDYYARMIRLVFTSIGVPVDKLEFITGSSYQYREDYSRDKYRLCAVTTEHDARKAGAEVVKEVESPLLSGLLYPLLQALDEQYLGVDIQFGGVDQRKIFTFAEASLPKLGYSKRIHLMNAMVPSMTASGKMSSSDPDSKIDFLDPPEVIKSKIKKAFCEPGKVEGNGVLAFCQAVIFPIAELKVHGIGTTIQSRGTWEGCLPGAPSGTLFSINRPDKFGGPLHYSSFEQLKSDYAAQSLFPDDLKTGVRDAVLALVKPIREGFEQDPKAKEVEKLAYGKQDTGDSKKKKQKNYTSKEDYERLKAEKAAITEAAPPAPTPNGQES